MPKNPELARCPRTGAHYKVAQQVPERVEEPCPAPPPPGPAWRVEATGEDRWRVSTGARVRLVSKQSGGALGAGTVVQISQFALLVTTNQAC